MVTFYHSWAYAEFGDEAVGCKAILLTADSPVLGIRWNETRNHLALPAGLGFPIMGQAAATAGKSSKDGFSSLNGKKFPDISRYRGAADKKLRRRT